MYNLFFVINRLRYFMNFNDAFQEYPNRTKKIVLNPSLYKKVVLGQSV